jgi:glycosyltransferase involved in cell wall biosynthesis
VKHQTLLARAFVRLLERAPELRSRCRLLIIGDGPLRTEIGQILAHAGASDLLWMPGTRNDVPHVLRTFDVFVLPSLAEGISNTILEAMATGLPVIATNVGGNAELIENGRTGILVAPEDVEALATAMLRYADAAAARAPGAAGRERVERFYGLDAMVASYCALYERLLAFKLRGSIASPGARAVENMTSGGH